MHISQIHHSSHSLTVHVQEARENTESLALMLTLSGYPRTKYTNLFHFGMFKKFL